MAKRFVVRTMLLLCLLLTAVVPAAPFSQMVILGDSLSDMENLSLATGGAIPGQPYFAGRFSDGPNYAERLAEHLGLPLEASLRGGSNFAYGGARTKTHPLATLGARGVLAQLVHFRERLGGAPADAEALYIVFAGANNLQDAIADPDRALSMVVQAVVDIRDILTTLGDLGARHILVPNVPDLGLVPRVTEQGAAAVALASAVSRTFNALLDITLDAFPHLNIRRFDTFTLLRRIVATPAAFGLQNVTARCYTGDDLTFRGGGTVCNRPDTSLFWDGIHPTAAGHALLAARMTATTLDQGRLRLEHDAFMLRARFALGVVNDGIDPRTEDVALHIGSLHTTIPAGSFVYTSPDQEEGTFVFAGQIRGVALHVRLKRHGHDTFTLRASGEPVDIAANAGPVPVILRIGNDTGTAQVPARRD